MLSDWKIEEAKKGVLAMEAEISRLRGEVEKLLNPIGGFKKYKEYPYAPKLKKDNRWLSEEYLPKDVAEKELGNWYSLCEKICKENQEAKKHNDEICRRATEFMVALGFAKIENYQKSRGSSKWHKRDAAWLQSIRSAAGNGGSWVRVRDIHKRLSEEIKKREEDRIKAEKQKEREAAVAKKERMANLEFALLAQKYVPDNATECTEEEVLDAILGSCKYLRLAHYMQENRGDWNDGPSYAECGLSTFTEEAEADKEIAEEISGLIHNWEGDGRVFRDCEWNYSKIFELCDDELLNHYAKMKSIKSGLT